MEELARWLGEQFDEDERTARAATDGPWTPWRGPALHGLGDLIHPVLMPGQKPGAKAVIVTASWLDAEHIAAWDPARVLREIDAKRRLLHQFEHRGNSVRATVAPPAGGVWDDLLRMLALPYSDRPGYRADWRP